MDCASYAGGGLARPCPGDVSVCLNCGQVSSFNDILVLKPLGPDAQAKLPDAIKARLAEIVRLIRERGRIR